MRQDSGQFTPVHEDEVEVVACSLDECGKAVGNVAVLKEAVEVEPKVEEDEPEHKEKDDEDAPRTQGERR
jgi:hypothetical protein